MSKAVLVYGIGISGCGAADILSRQGKRVLLYNDAGHDVDNDLKELLAKNGGQIVIGKKEGLLDDVEEVILSPGISMENPLVQEALKRGINVTGEAELAYRNYNGHIVGITGTNGKTTTTILIGEMLATLPCAAMQLNMALVVVLPCAPATATPSAWLSSSANTSDLCITFMPCSLAATSSQLSGWIADEITTASAPFTCPEACP